jgi:hypothetical protein
MNPKCLGFLLLVVVCPCFATITITTPSVPNGTVKTPYSAVISAKNGCAPYKWAIASGALPAGVSSKTSSTTLSFSLNGTPTKAGTYSFAVKVTGCGGGVSQVAYKVAIQAGPNHEVDLSWKASTTTNVVGYNVYRSPDAATWRKLNTGLIGSTLYNDSTVANSSTYYYSATAVDAAGHESTKTAPVKATVP